MKFTDFLLDDDHRPSTYRLCFLLGVVAVITFAGLQFFGIGMLPTAIYTVIAVLVSGGYMTGKYMDASMPTIPQAPEPEITQEDNGQVN